MLFNTHKRIHFIGIGGSGMSGIAEILAASGHTVSGSDVRSSLTTQRLEKMGLRVLYKHDPSHVQDVDLVVFSSAVNKENPEIHEASQRGIPLIHRSEMLCQLMHAHSSIAVAGTHGKTTTTSLLAFVLWKLNLDPTVVAGGKIHAFQSHARKGNGRFFIAEADESDGSFLRMNPFIAVITNIDRDHLDHYKNFEEIISTFEKFLARIHPEGAICACIDDPIIRNLLPHIQQKVITYGLSEDADVRAIELHSQGMETSYIPVIRGKPGENVRLSMPGNYNVVNSLVSFAVGDFLQIPMASLGRALTDFSGVEHRFTVMGEENGVMVVDDYAHNPKKIETVIGGSKESFPTHRLLVIFQPHRFSRLQHMMEEFAGSFRSADAVIVTPVYDADEKKNADITEHIIADRIQEKSFPNEGKRVYPVATLVEAAEYACSLLHTKSFVQTGTKAIVLTVGAGDVRQAGKLILENMRKQNGG